MKKLWIGFLGLVLAVDVGAANWVLIDENKEAKTYVDTNNIVIKSNASGHLVGTWEKIELNTPSVTPGFGATPLKQMVYFNWNDCKNNLFSDIAQAASYDANGKVISTISADYASLKFKMVIPGTVGERLKNFICIAAFAQETKGITDTETLKKIDKAYYSR